MEFANSLISINGEQMPTLEILVLLTVMMLLPSIVIMMTSFLRIVIILSFTRTAIGIQQTPPNMVLIGMALFLTLFIMNPVMQDINTEAYEPYKAGEITQEEALDIAAVPMKEFMLQQTEVSALNLFTEAADSGAVENPEELSLIVIVPAKSAVYTLDNCFLSDDNVQPAVVANSLFDVNVTFIPFVTFSWLTVTVGFTVVVGGGVSKAGAILIDTIQEHYKETFGEGNGNPL